MRLPRFIRTSSFRLTLLYAELFFASVFVLFAAMYWYGTGFLAGQIDTTVVNEIAEVRSHAGSNAISALQPTVVAYARQAPPGMYYLLQSPSRHVLAGNLPAMKPIVGTVTWWSREQGGSPPVGTQAIRGRGLIVGNGDYLFIAVDASDLDQGRALISRIFLWGIMATVVLSLVGGTIMSVELLRRVESVSRASREIMAGDLGRRLPIRGSEDEFDHLTVSLNTMLERIESLMIGLREVSSDIAHDLRTPLSRLRQRLERASRKPLSQDDLQDVLDKSLADVDGILETFAALLRIAQIEARAGASVFTRIDLSELIDEMVDDYRTVAESRSQTLVADIAPSLTIQGDRELLVQLFANLFENAIRHSPESSPIRVSAANGKGVEVTITDNGPGIPVELREKVFQRFYRLEHSRTTEGTGLGLSLVAAIAGLHGAKVVLGDNDPGLRVSIDFPQAR